MNYRLFCLGLLVIVFAGTFAMSSQNDPSKSGEDHTSRVQILLKERRDVLSKRSESIGILVKNGRVSQAELIDANDDVFAAELDLAESQGRRIEVLKSRVENLKSGEEYVVSLKRLAKVTEADVLAARSRRLLAEIELERALASSSTEPIQ